jgi:hypothetical protein
VCKSGIVYNSDGTCSSIGTTQTLSGYDSTNLELTVVLWTFVFNAHQNSTLYHAYMEILPSQRYLIYSMMIDDGKLAFYYNYYSGGIPNYSKVMTSSKFYSSGWNMIVFQYSASQTKAYFHSSISFQLPLKSQEITTTQFSAPEFFLLGSSYHTTNNNLINSYEGIIHSVWIHQEAYTTTQIESLFLPPLTCNIK